MALILLIAAFIVGAAWQLSRKRDNGMTMTGSEWAAKQRASAWDRRGKL